jgi:hypothetical protein
MRWTKQGAGMEDRKGAYIFFSKQARIVKAIVFAADNYALHQYDNYALHQYDNYALHQYDNYALQQYGNYALQQYDNYALHQYDNYALQQFRYKCVIHIYFLYIYIYCKVNKVLRSVR